MNIVYMHTHDTGRYIQPYGHAVPTPNLQAFSEEGLLFRHAYCAGPTCSPSRTSLLTGMCPHTNGMIGLAHRGFAMKDPSRHLGAFLRQNGYETALSGMSHEGEVIFEKCYDRVLTEHFPGGPDQADLEDRANSKNAAEFILSRSPSDRPFFLSFGMRHTHRPFNKNLGDVKPQYVVPPSPLADNARNREDMAEFTASAKVMDECVGVVLDALRQSGLDKDTFVFFTTDHGIAFPFMKCSLYDAGIGVSLIMRYPGLKRQGEATDALVSHLDVFPTLCDLIGLDKPGWLEGRSMLPILNGESEKIRDEIFSEVTFHAAYEPKRCIRTERYKLIRRYDEHDSVVPANIDAGLSKEHVVEHGLLANELDRVMLFDLALDPNERQNLIGNPAYREIGNELSRRLDGWMEETRDPLLKGKVPKPPGAKVNRLDCLEPNETDFEDPE
ncbi:sulfatase [Paenibacillus sp. HJGM_3]|uniref:sulfatase family protein n=1 Tax=Paenibacillus sp. HJGM_3 TaxID=3379816 RepID=UPI00385D56EA